MDLLYIVLISCGIIFFFLIILLAETKTSNNIERKGSKLTVWHPLKKEVIDLETDLISWNVQRMKLLWWGKLYAVNMQLKSGKWKKIYARSRRGKFYKLISYLKKNELSKQSHPSL
ncbi:hypothetical protein [Algoriphagus vanfongensis]|uniref:hypothetical protein n=1 Tax=Algoriphagus vanfongensis TaxID=426371 RepID=UPI0003FED6C2|nr:hypothetical protein [Algoriphagus vanfongensis]